MKNMMLPVRNFSMLLLAAALCFASCDDKNKPTPTPTEQDLNGNAARPTWTAAENPDMTASMTAVIAVQQLNGVAIPDSCVGGNDVLAAFSGETCLGIAQYNEEAHLFFLYIAGPTTNDQGQTTHVTLRYWSAHYTNLFELKDAFRFANDTQLGSPAEPYIPAFVKAE